MCQHRLCLQRHRATYQTNDLLVLQHALTITQDPLASDPRLTGTGEPVTLPQERNFSFFYLSAWLIRNDGRLTLSGAHIVTCLTPAGSKSRLKGGESNTKRGKCSEDRDGCELR